VPTADVSRCSKKPLLNYLVGEREQRWRQSKAECFGALKIDDQLELGWLLYREFAGLLPLKNACNIVADLAPSVVSVGTIAHEAASSGGLAEGKTCRQHIAHSQFCDLIGLI
jgi:hypothetical protein